MAQNIQSPDQDGTKRGVLLDVIPDACPLCSRHGQPEYVISAMHTGQGALHAVFRCPVTLCRGLYVGVYRLVTHTGGHLSGRLIDKPLAHYTQKKAFPKNISSVSAGFCDIYNQALIAEENGLDQVCGPGYRKALEFLIKDYLVEHRFKGDAARQEDVKKGLLGPVIEKFIDEDRIKQCAKRAAWLGNDETHYLRKWTDKDVGDLKSLIVITANYIDMVIESERYMQEMPPGGASAAAASS